MNLQTSKIADIQCSLNCSQDFDILCMIGYQLIMVQIGPTFVHLFVHVVYMIVHVSSRIQGILAEFKNTSNKWVTLTCLC